MVHNTNYSIDFVKQTLLPWIKLMVCEDDEQNEDKLLRIDRNTDNNNLWDQA